MRFQKLTLTAGAALCLAAFAGTAAAHHGWGWTADEESELTGTIEAIALGNPHARLDLRTADGVWDVDLAPPSATARSGLVEGMANAGDEATVTGHRSRDPEEKRFKAETITVGGETYDVYPSRDKTLNPS
ncbi:MAG: hypothetical protein H7Y08_09545 [Rhizobiaceae bacterium]|nr:hypothetical protein [Rhizobiaceae bacterium]